jgi:hypothetical protein
VERKGRKEEEILIWISLMVGLILKIGDTETDGFKDITISTTGHKARFMARIRSPIRDEGYIM